MKSTDIFENELGARLEGIRAEGLHRQVRRVDSAQGAEIVVEGKTLLNFSSNDYLGLADHPSLIEASIEAAKRYGAGSGASRLICGSLGPHHELEERLADFKGTEAALVFSTGYATAIGTITAMLGKQDVIIVDKLVHACIVDAVRLCGAKLRVFAHNDLEDLERILRWAVKHRGGQAESRAGILIVTESVFSMDGDLAPLRNIVEFKEKYGAWLMVDEAHATGLFGEKRRGLIEEFGVSGQVEIQMGTLGKAVGASGGYICGSRKLADYLVNRARSFIFSTAPVPAAAAAARAGLELIRSDEGRDRCLRLWTLVDLVKNELVKSGWTLPAIRSAILPLIIGDEAAAVERAADLRNEGVFIPAIRYPTVARGEARMRLTMTASHTAEHIEQFIEKLAGCATPGREDKRIPIPPESGRPVRSNVRPAQGAQSPEAPRPLPDN